MLEGTETRNEIIKDIVESCLENGGDGQRQVHTWVIGFVEMGNKKEYF